MENEQQKDLKKKKPKDSQKEAKSKPTAVSGQVLLHTLNNRPDEHFHKLSAKTTICKKNSET